MGEARKRAEAAKLQVLNGGKAPERPPKSVPQVAVTIRVPRDMLTELELRHSVVAAQYPTRQDFLLACLGTAMAAFDARRRQLVAEKTRLDALKAEYMDGGAPVETVVGDDTALPVSRMDEEEDRGGEA